MDNNRDARFMRKIYFCMTCVLSLLMFSCRTAFIYTEVSVPEEGTFVFEKVTDESIETVGYPSVFSNGRNHITFNTNRTMAVSPDGKMLYYLAISNKQVNIYRKDLSSKNIQTQRTFRSNISNVAISPDGKQLCFSEIAGDYTLLYQTDASVGSIVRQISAQNVKDAHPYYQKDGSKIFFDRSGAIWSYDLQNGQVVNYCRGYQPFPLNDEEFLCYRESTNRGEIWKVNFVTGHESVIVSLDERWFITPSLSPDGKWILLAGNTIPNGNMDEENVDIYVVKTDGSNLTQLTYHKGHDICPIWSADGKHIYFLSQRGTEDGSFNIWKVNFSLK